MLIVPSAIEEYLARPLRDSRKAKRFVEAALDAKLAALDPLPRFHTAPRHLGQKITFLLGVKYPRYGLFLDMGVGKLAPLTEPVLTPSGYRTMGSLRVGDRVIGSSGQSVAVTGVFPQGIQQIYRVCFSDGAWTRCGADHLWQVTTPARKHKGYQPVVKTTQELRELGLFHRSGNAKYYIPVVGPVHFDPLGPLNIHPYLLGVLLGDGCLTSGSAAFAMGPTKQHVIDKVINLLPVGYELSPPGNLTYRIIRKDRAKGNVVIQELRALGLYGHPARTKFIPRLYLRASVDERGDLLQGLLDTDGYASKSGAVQWTTASKELARDVTFLVRSLGGVTRRSSKIVKGWRYYTLTLNLPEGLTPFSLPRKADRCGVVPRKYWPTRAIVSIEKDGREEAQCISVGAADGLYVTRNFVVTHNTWCALNLWRQARRKAKVEGAVRPRLLALVPGSHNVGEWVREAKKHVPALNVAAADDRGEEAKWQILEDPDVHGCVMTYAAFLRQVCKGKKQKDGSLKGWTVDKKKLHRMAGAFSFIVYDECTQFGSNTSLSFRACRALSWMSDYVYALSGTPFGNDPKALWSIFYVVDKGETLGETLGLFRAAFYKEKDNFWKGWPDYVFDKDKIKALRKMIRHNSIRYLITEVEDLEEPIRVVVPVEFNHENFQYYHRLVDELQEARGSFRMVENVFTRLRSLTAGWLALKLKDEDGAIEEDDVEVVFKHNPKLDAVVEDLKLVPEEAKVVIFHWYKKSGDLICDRLKEEKIRHARLSGGQSKKAGDVVQRFLTDPKVNVLVSSSAGAYGGNWQAANYMFMFESPTDPKLRAQEERRIWRIGQTRTCVYRDYVVTGSIDEKILKAVGEGRDLLRDVMEGGVL